jgi:hypothetical protein
MEGIFGFTVGISAVSNLFKFTKISPLSEINRSHIQSMRQPLPILSKRLMGAPDSSAHQLGRLIESKRAANVRGGELM